MEKEYALWLCNLPGIGNVRGRKLLELCGGSAKKLYDAPDRIWKQVISDQVYEKVKTYTEGWRLSEEYEKLQEKNIGLAALSDRTYPEKLRNIPDAPFVLFYKGKLEEYCKLSVAVVGARDCSEYGSYVAEGLGRALGKQGIPLISGMARGIDGISQQAALDQGGSSYGVLGCGVDICYPAGNRKLYDRLVRQGAVLSPYPPGTEPRAGNFPPRNRIVSGMADAVVVVEARNRSGTLITVDMALEQGRDVYVAPGRVTDRLSDGCNRLLKQGAQVFLSPEDFLEDLFAVHPEAAERTKRAAVTEEKGKTSVPSPSENLSLELKQVYEALDFTPRSIGQINDRLPFPCAIGSLSSMLMVLCMKKLAVQVSPGYFCILGKATF